MAMRLVVVTGASSGIGEAVARIFAQGGAHVILIARREEKLAAVVQSIREAGGAADAVAADLSSPSELRHAADRIKFEFGAPDVLVNNAGLGRWIPLLDTSAEEVREMIGLPYLAAFNMTRELLPAMIAAGKGRIAFVTSPASYMVWPKATGYIAARHAIRGLANGLREDLRGTGVGVSLIVLGTVESSYWENNPGSRENVPKGIPLLMPTLSVQQAGETILRAVERERNKVVRPWFFRVLFALQPSP